MFFWTLESAASRYVLYHSVAFEVQITFNRHNVSHYPSYRPLNCSVVNENKQSKTFCVRAEKVNKAASGYIGLWRIYDSGKCYFKSI